MRTAARKSENMMKIDIHTYIDMCMHMYVRIYIYIDM